MNKHNFCVLYLNNKFKPLLMWSNIFLDITFTPFLKKLCMRYVLLVVFIQKNIRRKN